MNRNWMFRFLNKTANEGYADYGAGAVNFPAGKLAILENFSLQSFSVVQVIEWDNVAVLSDDHIIEEDGTIIAPNPFGSSYYRPDEGTVPVQILDFYSSMNLPTEDRLNQPGSVKMVGPQNLYSTFDELINKEARVAFPDVLLSVVQQPHIVQFMRDYPQLIGDISFLRNIEYESYPDVLGYAVMALRDQHEAQRAKERDYSNWPTWYWYIPELKKRSLYNEPWRLPNKADQQALYSILGSNGGRYHTPQEAANAAEKYIEYFLYGSAV